MIEYFFLTAKALTIYSLGFGIAVASDRKKKKEPTFLTLFMANQWFTTKMTA